MCVEGDALGAACERRHANRSSGVMNLQSVGDVLFALSAVLLVGTAALLTRYLAHGATESFWTFIACISLQLGFLTCGLSVAGRLTPAAWLAGQGLLLSGVFLWTLGRPRPGRNSTWRALRGWWSSRSLLGRAAATLSLVFVLLSGVRQVAEPVSGFDDRMYHGSRVAYWIENHSVLPYPTHNERQVAFPFGSELFFMWPVLFTKCEVAGRIVFWLGYPAAAAGIYLVTRAARVPETFASLAALLFVSTPIVSSLAIGLAPEFWLAVFELGTAFWILVAIHAEDRGEAARSAAWAGLFLFLALNVKTTAVGLLVPALLLPFLACAPGGRVAAARALIMGALVALTLSGLAVNCLGNVVRCGNPFASAGLRRVVRGDLSVRQLYVHAVRLPFLLFELPWAPGALRARLEEAGQAAARRLGATRPLSFESNEQVWPGRFSFNLPATAVNYSLGGLLWLPTLAVSLVVALRGLRGNHGGANEDPLFFVTLLAALSLFPVVFGLRWMVPSNVPSRFLIAAWALGTVLLAVLTCRSAAGGNTGGLIAAVVLGLQIVPSLQRDLKAAIAALRTPLPEAVLDEPFAAVMPEFPAGSRILLFANQDTRDYPLFRPRDAFSNRVVPWGDEVPTLSGVIDRTLATGTTDLLFVADQWLARHWAPPIRVAETITLLSKDPMFREISTGVPGMRLFKLHSVPPRKPAP